VKVPTQREDQDSLVKQIAIDVYARRKAGEKIPDEQVLNDFPELHDLLREQLDRLRRLESARLHVDTPTPPPASDLAQTCQLPPLNEAVDDLRIAVKEQRPYNQYTGTSIVASPVPDGSSKPKSTVPHYRPTVRAPMAVIKVFHDGTTNFNSYPVLTDRYRIGRIDGDLVIVHDYWMSGRHAEIQRRRTDDRYQWFLVDLESTNGTFIRAHSVVLRHNDELFLGQERYRFCNQNGRAGLIHATKGVGQQWWFKNRREPVGQSTPCGIRCFSTDPFLDPVHAEFIQRSDGTWTIQDHDSQNGVWYRVSEVELKSNSAFQLGEQRFGFWFNEDEFRAPSAIRP
jgi:hypothetical protein